MDKHKAIESLILKCALAMPLLVPAAWLYSVAVVVLGIGIATLGVGTAVLPGYRGGVSGWPLVQSNGSVLVGSMGDLGNGYR